MPVVILIFIAIFFIAIIFLPLFVWGIHNQTKKATKELIKLNKEVKRLSSILQSGIRLGEQPAASTSAEKKLVKNQVDPLVKGRFSERTMFRKKVFIKPDDEIPGRREQSG